MLDGSVETLVRQASRSMLTSHPRSPDRPSSISWVRPGCLAEPRPVRGGGRGGGRKPLTGDLRAPWVQPQPPEERQFRPPGVMAAPPLPAPSRLARGQKGEGKAAAAAGVRFRFPSVRQDRISDPGRSEPGTSTNRRLRCRALPGCSKAPTTRRAHRRWKRSARISGRAGQRLAAQLEPHLNDLPFL